MTSSSKARGRIPTVDAVEKSGRWVSARHSAVGRGRVEHWRKIGLLKPGSDFQTRTCHVARGGAKGPLLRSITFYRISRLRALASTAPSVNVVRKLKRYREGQEEYTEGGVTYLRAGAAAALVGVTRAALHYRSRHPTDGIEIKPLMRQVAGRTTYYYSLADLRALKAHREITPATSREEVSLKEACRLIGRSKWTLTDVVWCAANGIRQKKRTVHRYRGARAIYSFDKLDLIAFATRKLVVTPADRVTATEAAKILRCSVTTVRTLCRSGVLEAVLGDVAVGRGWTVKKGWLPTRESVERARAVVQSAPNKIRAGWMLREYACRRSAQHKLALSSTAAKTTKPVSAPVVSGDHSPVLTHTQAKARNKGGRPRSDRTAAIHEFCWRMYRQEGKKRRAVMELANKNFGTDTIRYESNVTTYSNAHADRLAERL